MAIRNNYRGNNMIRTTQKVSTFIGNTGPTGSTGSTGATGSTGSTGATGGSTGGLDYVFETTTTDSDQGTGKVWLNNTTRSSATVLYIDDNDVDSTDVSAYIATWDDSSTSSTRGYVKIYQRADNSIYSIFNISGASTDATAYYKIPVSHLVSVGTIADADPIDVFFSRTGNAGSGLASLVDDTSPQLGGFLDAAGNYIQMEKGGDISSASPTVIDTDGDYFAVTGTTNFSAFTVAADRHFFLEFGAVLTMTHGNGTLDLPGGANITTAASDVGEFVSTAANVVTCVNYTKRDGTAVVATTELSGDSSPQLGGFLDANGNYIQMQKGGDISSASPLVIDTDGDYFVVTGTTNFSAMTVAADRHFFLEFAAILTITHAGGTIDIPGAANYTSVASDVIECVSTASNVVTIVGMELVSGKSQVESVTLGNTATLTSKSLTAPIITGSASAAGTVLFKEDTDNGTNACTLSGPQATADVTVTLPAATDTLVGKATTDTLTNKTLTAPAVTNLTGTFNSPTGTIGAVTLGGAVTGGDQTLTAVNLKDYGHITVAKGDTSGANIECDMNDGNCFSATISTDAVTFTFVSPTASDELCMFILFLINGGSQTVNWPGSVDWAGGTAPSLTASGVDILTFFTITGGTVWHGVVNSADSK